MNLEFNTDTNSPEYQAMVINIFTKITRVDVLLECYPISTETQKELLTLMPDAYGGEVPGEDSWPEPDAKRDEPYKLSRIWIQLSEAAKADILKARGR